MRLRRQVAVLIAVLAVACSSPVPLDQIKASVSLSEPELFYEAGDPIPLTVSIFNPSADNIDLGTGLQDGSALELLDGQGSRQQPSSLSTPSAILGSQQRTRLDLDPVAVFPGLSTTGRFRLTAVYPLFRSNTVELTVLPRIEPEKDYRAVVETELGSFTLSFYPDVAPRHVRNFINLARMGFYDQVYVHRVIPGKMIQTGDPSGTGRSGPGYTIRAEFNDRPHVRGTLSMARLAHDPHSAGSQWFVTLGRVPDWDGQYTVFGEVGDGMEVVDLVGNVEVKDDIPRQPVLVHRVTISEAGAS